MRCTDEWVTVGRPDSPCEGGVSGLLNPTTVIAEELELLAELHLSPGKLQALTGVEDLKEVTVLELCVDTRQSTLSNLGTCLPNLAQLKMNGSVIASVRDLGTTLSRLQVLWMARCCLADLDGILAFTSLKELYVAYNDISDLSYISLLEHLELLDLEGNSIDDLSQVQYLGLCSSLRALTLDGNPVCAQPHPDAPQTELYCYRSAVRQLIPQLCYLDDVPAGDSGARCSTASLEDWVLIGESIKEGVSEPPEERAISASVSSQPGSAHRPGTAPGPLSSAASRPGSARATRSASSGPGSADSGLNSTDPGASDLTHGTGQVMCGNPGQALRTRHRRMNLQEPRSKDPDPFAQFRHIPERSFHLDKDFSEDPRNVLAELRLWREEHNRWLIAIGRDCQAQVMKVSHSDGKDDEDDEEGRGSTLSSMSNEEKDGCRGAGTGHWSNVGSPDSSFQSPGPEFVHEREPACPDVPRHPLSPDPPRFPSPPLIPMAPPAGRKALSEMRRRRFCFRVPEMKAAKATEEPIATETGGRTGVLVLEARNPKTHLAPSPCNAGPQRPTSSPAAPCSSRMHGRAELQPVKGQHLNADAPPHLVPLPPACPRPHTTRGAVQRPPRRPVLTPDWGSAHCS